MIQWRVPTLVYKRAVHRMNLARDEAEQVDDWAERAGSVREVSLIEIDRHLRIAALYTLMWLLSEGE